MEKKEYENFVLSFFQKLNCKIELDNGVYTITKVPRSFLDFSRLKEPLKFSFSSNSESVHVVNEGSRLGQAISNFLNNSGKKTLLQINFNVDPIKEIEKRISLKNCSIESVTKEQKNHFFSRFSFLTTLRTINKSKKIISEIYVHNGKIVKGNLKGYDVIDGNLENPKTDFLKRDFESAKEELNNIIKDKLDNFKELAKEELDNEVLRINKHYEQQLREITKENFKKEKRISELETELAVSDEQKKPEIQKKINRLKSSLNKDESDEIEKEILKEKEVTLKDTNEKYSLDLNYSLLNTTIIYYPVFSSKIYLKSDISKRYTNLIYDPLIDSFENNSCETCKTKINEITLCKNGHVTCGNCLTKCNGCNNPHCEACVSLKCNVCTISFCRDCLILCRGCNFKVCNEHLRKDCVSGEDRCVNCLEFCNNCHEYTEKKNIGNSEDGSKICLKCLGEKRRSIVLKEVFRNN